MQKIFTQEIRFKDADGKDFPEWEEKKLGEVLMFLKSGKDKAMLTGDFPVFGSTGKIGFTKTYSFDGEYILIARVGANAGRINYVKNTFGVTDNTLILKPENFVSIKFLFFLLIINNLNRLVFGSGQPLVTAGQLRKIRINYPSLPEQTHIANFLTALDKKIALVNEQIEKTKAYKKGLLQKMFV